MNINKQHFGIVKERNLYRQTLKECLSVFNELPKQKIMSTDVKDTYKLATKIEKVIDGEQSYDTIQRKIS